MSTLRKCLLALLVGVVGGCGGAPTTAPSGPATAGSPNPNGSTAPSSDPAFEAFRSGIAAVASKPVGNVDARRESLITAMGLRASLGTQADLILAVAAAAEDAARAKPTAHIDVPQGTIVYAMAILPVAPQPPALQVLPPPAPPPNAELRIYLSGILKGVGNPGPQSISGEPQTATASASDGGMTGTTTMTTTVTATAQGSVAKVEMKRDLHSVVTDSGGATTYDGTRKYKVTGQINVCPTSAGVSDASIVNTVDEDVTIFPGSAGRVGLHATANLASSSTFRGRVDDQANLGGVTQDYSHHENFRRTAQAEGGPEATHEGSFGFEATGIQAGVPTEREWGLTIGDYSDSTGTVESTGDAMENMITSTVLSAADDFTTIDSSFVEAQRLWRNGRCVMVTVPAYGAETELEPSLQNSVTHTEEVDKGSTTEFEANLKHRFGDSLTASISAELATGKEKLTPASIAAPPGTLTYKAPDENGKDALVRLRSTSRRGIGTLVLEFHTGPKNLKVKIEGTLNSSGLGITFVTKVSVPKIVLTKQPDGTYAGSGPATSTTALAGVCTVTEKATIKLTATREKVEDQALARKWFVKWDPTTKITSTARCPGGGGSLTQLGAAGYMGLFMTVLGDLKFPENGGGELPPIRKSKAFGPTKNTIEATVTGEIVSDSGG